MNKQIESEKFYVTADQEAWLKKSLWTLVRLIKTCEDQRRVGADDTIVSHAIDGAVNGTAIEIIKTLGKSPSYANLRQYVDHVNVEAKDEI